MRQTIVSARELQAGLLASRQQLKEETNGNTNWSGYLGRHAEGRQRNHKTRQRRIRRFLLIFIAIRERQRHKSGRIDRRRRGRLLLDGAGVQSRKGRSSRQTRQYHGGGETGAWRWRIQNHFHRFENGSRCSRNGRSKISRASRVNKKDLSSLRRSRRHADQP